MRDANALLAARTREIVAAHADVARRQARLDTAVAALADFQTKLDTRRDQVDDDRASSCRSPQTACMNGPACQCGAACPVLPFELAP